jgi:transketolase
VAVRSVDAMSISELEDRAYQLRRDVLEMIHAAGSGHPGGSLSAADIVAAVFGRMRFDPANPAWPDRDRFVLSKGHAAPILYAALARAGFFSPDDLKGLRKLHGSLDGDPGRSLQGHPDQRTTPGVEVSTGSLGNGFSFAQGVALAGKLDEKSYRVYALVGDGEMNEGQIWEAAMFAAHHSLNNLTAIVDVNRIQNDGFVRDILQTEPIVDKWRSFGWHVIDIDGHDLAAIVAALDEAQQTKGRPTAIVCRTVKGKGVSFMEDSPEYHGKAPNDAQLAQALEELATAYAARREDRS